MLTHLTIRDFAIVPSLELDFDAGFTAITGETGAGKSILVDALGLLLGDRSDSSWVGPGADKAELSAVFDLSGNEDARGWLADAGIGAEDECILRRAIAASGRSRAWINGTPVTVQQLGELGNLLVELHGQNEHVRLAEKSQQYQLLDASGDYAARLERTEAAFREWKRLQDDFDAVRSATAMPAGELELLRYQLDELRQHAMEPEALADLEQEHRRLARGGALLEAIQAGTALLDDEDRGAGMALQSALHRLEQWETLDPDIAEARQMLQEAAINCQEASSALSQAADRVDLSPEHLQAVADRLDVLGDLARKHQVDMAQLATVRDRLAERLASAEDFEARRDALAAQCDDALAAYRAAAADLSRDRGRHATILSADVSALMGELGMAGGTFEIRIDHDPDAPPSARGDDRIELVVSANPGIPPGPLAKIASGGELSRISLAIKVAARRAAGARTQIFDEVDAGIGGDTANAVGTLLRRLAGEGQSLCVTHLAQVAVCATRQLQVRKEASAERTRIDTRLLGDDERVEEIARMLSGRVSDQSRAHAADLLSAARGGPGRA